MKYTKWDQLEKIDLESRLKEMDRDRRRWTTMVDPLQELIHKKKLLKKLFDLERSQFGDNVGQVRWTIEQILLQYRRKLLAERDRSLWSKKFWTAKQTFLYGQLWSWLNKETMRKWKSTEMYGDQNL